MTEPTEERPVLVALSGAQQGHRHLLDQDETYLGRSPEAQIQVSAEDASRLHARIYRRGDGALVLEDRGSRNGTSVNNVPVRKHVLRPGDRIRLGNEAVFLFTHQSPLEEKFLEAQKLESIGRLAGGIAHDFNNLMAALLADIDYLRQVCSRAEPPPPDTVDCLDNMERAARRSVELTSQLLSFAQRGAFVSQLLDLSELVQEVAQFMRRSLGARIEVKVEVEPNLHVVGDRAQLRQMLVNLCLNARDAMDTGGVLEIRGEGTIDPGKGQRIAITVRDTGRGIPEDQLQHIFEPFYTTKEVGKGSGLGLAAVHGIVRKHGGEISVESTPEAGTKVTVWLAADAPVRDMRSRPSSTTTTSSPTVKGAVLLAEDDVGQRREVTRWLGELGYHVLPAADGQEALLQYVDHRDTVELVILDLMMPKLGGKETFRRLRQLDPDVKVLLVSGYVDRPRINELLAEGAIAFLEKPIDPVTFKNAVRDARPA